MIIQKYKVNRFTAIYKFIIAVKDTKITSNSWTSNKEMKKNLLWQIPTPKAMIILIRSSQVYLILIIAKTNKSILALKVSFLITEGN
jgi:hypothetical protein